jgi:arsenate reductase (thioredoxin)
MTLRKRPRFLAPTRLHHRPMYATLQRYIDRAVLHTPGLPRERKLLLDQVAAFVSSKRRAGETAELTFVCTHNSRRSQMAQLWAAAAAAHFGVEPVRTYSGGTEATAFNPRAVTALTNAGFQIENPGGDNPRYRVTYADGGPVLTCFSKTYDDAFNPREGFAAIMTCSEADEACPVVHGAARCDLLSGTRIPRSPTGQRGKRRRMTSAACRSRARCCTCSRPWPNARRLGLARAGLRGYPGSTLAAVHRPPVCRAPRRAPPQSTRDPSVPFASGRDEVPRSRFR